MPTRYDPVGGTMARTPAGHYITYAEHEALVQELLESIGDWFQKIERGESTAEDAEKVVKVFVRLRS